MVGADLITIGVKNQAPRVSFKNYATKDSISISSHECTVVMDSDSLDILEAIPYYGAQEFSLHVPIHPLPSYMITCTLPYSDNEIGDILHLLGHLLLTSRVDFTSFGSMFKSRTYQLLGITSLGSNSQAHHGSFGYSLTSTGSEFRDPHVFAIMLAYSLGAYTTTFGSM